MRATLLFIRQSILVHKIANKIRFIFAISLLIFSFSLKSQSNFNNGIDRLITFEPNWGGVSLKVFSRDPNVEDIKISSRFFNPRIGFFLFKNTELGFGYTFIKVKSNHPSVQPGKAYALGYFLRYHLSFLNFWQGTNKKGKKYSLPGKPFVEFDHEFSTFGQDSLKNHSFTPHLSNRRFNSKFGVNFRLFHELYFSIGIIHSYNPDYYYKRSQVGVFNTLGYTFTKKRK